MPIPEFIHPVEHRPVRPAKNQDISLVITHRGPRHHAARSIGPLARVSAPKPNKTWGSNVRPFDSHFPQWFKLSRNLPQFVSPHPDLFFIPDTLK